jgi:hypothetical protein
MLRLPRAGITGVCNLARPKKYDLNPIFLFSSDLSPDLIALLTFSPKCVLRLLSKRVLRPPQNSPFIPSFLPFAVPGFELRALHLLGRCTKPHPLSFDFSLFFR